MKLLNPASNARAAKFYVMKKMLVFVVLCLGLNFSYAQPPRAEKLEAIKVAYITKELSLTSDEAQKFWPVYNQYFAELKKAREDNKTDELVFEEKALNIRKKYRNEFKKVLNDDNRVNKVFVIDRNFKEILRREMMNRQKNRPKGTKFQPND
jgi:Skp family chaperone for outer membrane proteins